MLYFGVLRWWERRLRRVFVFFLSCAHAVEVLDGFVVLEKETNGEEEAVDGSSPVSKTSMCACMQNMSYRLQE